MKASSAIGLVVAVVGIALGATMEGSNVAAVLNPTALLIVLGGTFGATMAGTSFDAVKNIPMMYKKAFASDPPDLNAQVVELVGYAEKARRDGLLALEETARSIEDPFLRKGIELAVDGTDPEELRDILEADIQATRSEHALGVKLFGDMGGYAPTLGIIGTVLGLVHVLGNLDDPSKLGPLIAGAFVATLWGVMSANVLWLPISKKLKRISEIELHRMDMLLEGIMAIQAGSNPRVIEQKLISFLPAKERAGFANDEAA